MKKSTKVWLIISVVLVILGGAIFALVMNNLDWDFTKLSTGDYVTNTYELNDDFSSIEIDSDVADFEFVLSDTKKCEIVCYEGKNSSHELLVLDDTLKISIFDSRYWYDHIGINLDEPKVTVFLPKSEYQTLSISHKTGDIKVPKELKFENADITLTTGDIKFCASVKNALNLSATTGDISVYDLSADSVDLNATTGDIYLSNVSCLNLISSTSTGEARFKNVIATDSFDIDATTGDVVFENSDAKDIKVSTTTGDIYGSILSEKVFVTETSTGDVIVPNTTTGGLCELHTTTGDIKITVESLESNI